MTIRDIAISFGYEVDKASENKANKSIEALKKTAQKALGAIAIYFSIKGLSALAQAASDAEALESQFNQVFDGIQDKASEALSQIASETGMLENRLKGSFTGIAAFAKTTGMSVESSFDIAKRATLAAADAAAFYDKSTEEVTESIRSLLKGNYAVDASLGMSVTETTRNIAANKAFGKSFNDLSEEQKQFTLLQMFEEANMLSGALGQAAREADTWTNQLGNLKQAMQDLAAAAGKTFLQPAVQVLKLLTNLIKRVTDGINKLNAEGTALNNAFKGLELILKFANEGEKAFLDESGAVSAVAVKFDRLVGKLRSVKSAFDRVLKAIGGVQNALKIMGVLAASIFVLLNGSAILGFLKSVIGLLNIANLKILFTVGVIALLFLAIDDFINFLKGNDSLIGEIFNKMGIDADSVRTKIIETWNKVKGFLASVWKAIKKLGQNIWLGIKNAIVNNQEQIYKTLVSVWKAIKSVLIAVWKAIYAVGSKIFGKLNKSIENSGGSISKIIDGVFKGILVTIQGVSDFITGVFTGDWNTAFDGIKTTAKGAFDTLEAAFGKLTPVVAGATAALLAYKTVTTFITIAQKAQAAATAIVTAAQKLFNTAVKKNPLMIIVTIIGAVVAAFIHLFKTNEQFREKVLGVWEKVSGAIMPIIGVISDAVSGLFSDMKNSAGDFLPVLIDVGKTIGGSLMEAAQSILPCLLDLASTVFPMLGDMLKQLVPLILELAGTLVGALFDVLQSLLPLISEIIVMAADLISQVLPMVIGLIEQLLPLVINIVQSILPVVIDLINQLLPVVSEIIKVASKLIKNILPIIINLISELLPIIMEIINSVLPIIIDLINQLLPIVMEIISSVLPIVVTLLKELLPILMQLINAVLPVISAVLKALLPIVKVVIDVALKTIMSLLKALMPIIAAVAKTLSKVLGVAFKAIGEVIKAVVRILQSVIKFITGVFTEDWGKAFNSIKKIFIGIFDGIKAYITGYWNIVKNIFLGAFNGIKVLFISWIGYIKDIVSSVFGGISDFIQMIWNGISSFFTTIFTTIWDTISGIFTTVKNFIWDIINNIWTNITTVFTSIKDTITNIITGVKDTIMNIFNNIADIATGFVDKFKGAFSGIKDFFKNTFDGLGDILKAPINVAISAINAVIGGINKLSWDVPDWVPGIGGKKFGFDIPEIPMLAKGSENAPDTFIAGEKGAELVTGGKGKKVFTALETSNIGEILLGIKSLYADLQTLVKAGSASLETGNAVSGSTIYNVTQNNYFQNTFNGERAAQERLSGSVETAASDATAYLARGLQFAR